MDLKTPLLFTQFFFWGFFLVVLVVFSLIHKHRAARNAFLFLASLFFYYKTSSFFFILLLFSTLVDYSIGFLIDAGKTKNVKKAWLALSVTINLLVLCYFKYSFFFTESFNDFFGTHVEYFNHFNYWVHATGDYLNVEVGKGFPLDKLLPPVGVSFFTFQTISYSVDIYRGHIRPVKSLLDFGFYVSYFPQLVAGPIVRAADFIPQLYEPYKVSRREFGIAIFWILKGLIKKLVLADYIAVNFVDRVFANPELFTGFENVMSIYGYSLQVYADFSGYTDIAIGIALTMGFRLNTNFNSPYKARSVGEFWKRWHISLSTWLKDYLYVPIGGNKSATFMTWAFYAFLPVLATLIFGIEAIPLIVFCSVAITLVVLYLDYRFPSTRIELAMTANLLITMLLGGFWHGPSWMFIIWGALNGLALVVFKYWKRISPYQGSNRWYVIVWTVFLTFTFISFTRIWFRSPDLHTANLILSNIWNNFGIEHIPEVISHYANVFYVMYVGMVIHWLPTKMKDQIMDLFVRMPLGLKIAVSVVTVFAVYQAISSDLQAFIYFQF